MEKVHISQFVEHIIRYGMFKMYQENEVIVQEGEQFQYLFVLIEGKAKVVPSSYDGADTLIEYLEASDFIGDIEVASEEQYYHTVKAIEKCEVIAIPKSRYDQLITDPIFSNFYIQNLTRKLHKASIKSKYTITLSAKDRFIQFLRDNQVGNVYTLTTTYADLAKFIGVTSRHLRRIMSELKKDEIIEVVKKDIILKEG